ncbi:MAG: LacI family DNA-binding transcriptional regulator [Firmicutes bacterium]|nr:LacI family DNA-binding transcriptional regulator [Bacillota bacterium]
MVSMKDIALKCGVSVATVSKALNGQPDIGGETRARIAKAAEEMGYMTNAAARALKTNRTYHLGVLFVDSQGIGLAHEYFSALFESFKEEAEAHGYDITFINQNVGGRKNSYLQHCLYRGVDGVLIACADFESPEVQELVDSDLPVVTIDHIFNNRLAVVSDNVSGTYQLIHHVYEKGHRNIAFLHGEMTSVTKNRMIGFYRACEELSLTVPEEQVIACAYHDIIRSEEATRRLLELPERPTCILFPDDYSYIGGMRAIMDSGLRIPEDISAVGYDGIGLADVIGLTTFRQDSAALGSRAAQGLISLIEHPRTTLMDRILVPGKLMAGKTVKDLNS